MSFKKTYIKDTSRDPIFNPYNKKFYVKMRVIPAVMLSTGFMILASQVFLPLVFFSTQDSTPQSIGATVLGNASGFNEFEFSELRPTDSQEQVKGISTRINVPKNFLLTVPKLGIENAVIDTNSTDLQPDNAIGHYQGSALPGETGNAFIYGHSVLPLFYNPKNYKTVFSTLNQLKPGDEIYITYNNKKLTYKVDYQEIQPPDNVDPIAPFKPDYFNDSTVTLMTCWPAGSKAKRLMVRASLVE